MRYKGLAAALLGSAVVSSALFSCGSKGKSALTAKRSLNGLCDDLVEVKTPTPRILQLTDMQVIDAAQRRTPDRISEEKISYWDTKNAKKLCYDHIRDLIAQTDPDLIIVTGDIVYGEFDDSGRIQEEFAAFMGSLGIPWAPVFGNHDNESAVGIDWQCKLYENAPNSLFHRGGVTGFGNYSVGLVHNGELLRVIYMLDSHGCRRAVSPEARIPAGLYPDQLELVRRTSTRIEQRLRKKIPSFAAYHIPTQEFVLAERQKYEKEKTDYYTLGVDVAAEKGDFGAKFEKYSGCGEQDLLSFWRDCGVDGVFVGHYHKVNTSILWDGVRLTFGLKTGAYDYYSNGQLGGTLIECGNDGAFTVHHVPTLVPYDPPFLL